MKNGKGEKLAALLECDPRTNLRQWQLKNRGKQHGGYSIHNLYSLSLLCPLSV